MGEDEGALLRLWRQKRGEAKPEDLSRNLVVQLGAVTEELNRRWYEANTGQEIRDVQRQIRHRMLRWMAATLDGRIQGARPSSRPSSCCRGRSRRQLRTPVSMAAHYAAASLAISPRTMRPKSGREQDYPEADYPGEGSYAWIAASFAAQKPVK